MLQIHEKIEQARVSAGLTQDEIAEKIGVKRSTYQYWEKKTPSLDKIMKVAEVLKKPLDYFLDEKDENLIKEPLTYLEQRREQKNTSNPYMVPMVPVKAQAGYIRSYMDVDFINQLDTYPIVPGIEPRGSTWRYFEVQGESMLDTLAPRDIVLCSFVPDFDWMDIKDNYVYVIIKADDVLIKRVKKMSTERWLLKSDNKEVKPEPVLVKDILEVWRARRVIGADLGPTKKTKHYDLD